MVRVTGSSGDSGFHRESQEDVKVKEEHREEVPTNVVSIEASLNTAKCTDQRSLLSADFSRVFQRICRVLHTITE
ncbi:hypothetical protein PHMEG_00022966 [Phytophthora megakarya]|uniref:Uncharacterized protein n=1 Tax=Phytophthora megakarya TaxID=4795 RepID=A0A225VI69_9STRA|nr:hypothetical protein PHMEG_00022966 [Phytophthora megakarya]